MKMRAGDHVQSPDGIIIVQNFNINGLCMVERQYPPFDKTVLYSSEVRKWPIVKRPGGRIGKQFKTIGPNGLMSKEYVAWMSLKKRSSGLCKEWTDFQVFAKWHSDQFAAYKDWETIEHGWSVPFDLLDRTNTIASPEKCCVVPWPVYSALRTKGRPKEDDLPIGLMRYGNRFKVTCSTFDKGSQQVGSFKTLDEAVNAYWTAKAAAVQYLGLIFWSYMPHELAMKLLGCNAQTVRDI